MTMAHSHFERGGHTLPFRNVPASYEDRRFDQDRSVHHYRLPPPHSSIPLGLNVDDRQKATERPPRREQLPSVSQLLCQDDLSSSYTTSSTPYHGRSPRHSPSTSHRSLDSQLRLHSPRDAGGAPFPPIVSPDNGTYHISQSTRLPSLSQVGIEPPRSHALLDQESPRGRYHTTSPGGSSHGSPVLQHHPGLRPERGAKAPTLPTQVVEERYVPGKGLCYIYADQTLCPKSIDGEPVNPNWGLTKAGKARKRLAQACIPCREKKIKCQPNSPKCDQCQKSGRDCRFESAPRGNRARSSSYDSHVARPGSREMMRSTPSSPREVDIAMHSMSPGSAAPTSRSHAPETQPHLHSNGRVHGLSPAQKRRRRGGPSEDAEDSSLPF